MQVRMGVSFLSEFLCSAMVSLRFVVASYVNAVLNAIQGQFAVVLREELPQIQEAFQRIRNGYKPLLSIVVCG